MVEPTWVRKPPRVTLRGRWRAATSGISWFVVAAAISWLAGLAAGVVAVSLEDWLLLGFGALLEVYSVVGLLFAARED